MTLSVLRRHARACPGHPRRRLYQNDKPIWRIPSGFTTIDGRGAFMEIESVDQTPIDGETWTSLYPAVGSLILNWAHLESVLEKWVATIYYFADGKSIDARIPRMYSDKVKFLRKCFERLGLLETYKSAALGYLDEADRLSKIRFIVTHGAVSNFYPSTGNVEFTRLDVDKIRSIHTVKLDQLSVSDILSAGHSSMQLCRNAVMLGHTMLSRLSGDQG
jgi:hypothetical protein